MYEEFGVHIYSRVDGINMQWMSGENFTNKESERLDCF